MTDHSKTTAKDVHGLLLEAHPEVNNINLEEAPHVAEIAGDPRDRLRLETFVAIRNLRTAIDDGTSATEVES
jgi:hypothetical protein